MKVAEKQAAIETIKAGYDRYIIMGGQGANNVRTTQMPGTYQTTGTATMYGNYGSYNATTTYSPGPVITSGSHDQTLVVRMFRDGEQGASNAISARSVLGPKWQDVVKNGVFTCAR